MDRSRDVSICIPTMNRSTFLKRLLDYYRDTHFHGPILVGDSSIGEESEANKKVVALYKGQLDVSLYEIPNKSGPQVLDELAPFLKTPYATFCADDDFLCTGGLAKCAEFLAKNPDYVGAHGKAIHFSTSTNKEYGEVAGVMPYNLHAIEANQPFERLKQYLPDVKALMFSTYRTEVWIEACKNLTDLSYIHSKYIFGEVIHGAISAIRGKIGCLDVLYLARQGHPANGYHMLDHFAWYTDEGWYESYKFFEDRIRSELKTQGMKEPGDQLMRELFGPLLTQVFRPPPKNQRLTARQRFKRSLLNLWLRLKKLPVMGPVLVKLKHNFVDSKNEWSKYSLSQPTSKYYQEFYALEKALSRSCK